MISKVLASCAVVVALLVARVGSAQTAQADSPQWLKDRRYTEGIGIRTGDLELHPGIAGEAGYDSNWMLRTSHATCFGGPPCLNGPPLAPVLPAAEFRVTPSLSLSTLGAQRREGDLNPVGPSVTFRASVNLTYRAFIGLSSDSTGANDISKQSDPANTTSLGADARADILPGRPVGGAVFATYARAIGPNPAVGAVSDPNLSFNRDDLGAGAELVVQPGSGTLDMHLGYQIRTAFFEEQRAQGFDNLSHEVFQRSRWRFRPRTALLYDATLRFISYTRSSQASTQGLVDSTPVRARIGLNGLITDRFAALAMVGWAASFYSTALPQQPQYDSVIGQAELKWFLGASPGISGLSELTLALSSISIGYTRDFQNSYLGNFYGNDRGYLRFAYNFASRALVTLEGGVGAIEYPKMYWDPRSIPVGTPLLRHAAFTDLRADATLFGEYRFTDTFGLNATLRYTANFSNTNDMLVQPNLGYFDMAWNRFEAFLGARWFM
jgi:hypothetical protein